MDNSTSNNSLKIRSIIKNYVKEDPTLFIKFGAVVITAITIILKVSFYFYKTGYGLRFGIDNALLREIADNNVLYQIAFYLVTACIFLLFNMIAITAYKKCKLLLYLLCFYLISVAIFSICIALEAEFQNLLEVFSHLYIFIGITCFLLTIMIHFLLFYPMLLARSKLKEARLKIKIEKIEKRIKKKNISQKSKDRNQNILNVLRKKESDNKQKSLENEFTLDKKSFTFRKLLIISLITIIIPFILAFIIGVDQSYEKKDYSIISSQEIPTNILNADFDTYVVLYRGSQQQIVAPCRIKNKSLSIYNNYQVRISVDNILTKSIKNMTIHLIDD